MNNFIGLKTALSIIAVTPHSFDLHCAIEIATLLAIGLYSDMVSGGNMAHKRRRGKHVVSGEKRPDPTRLDKINRMNRKRFQDTVRQMSGWDASIASSILEEELESHPFVGGGGA